MSPRLLRAAPDTPTLALRASRVAGKVARAAGQGREPRHACARPTLIRQIASQILAWIYSASRSYRADREPLRLAKPSTAGRPRRSLWQARGESCVDIRLAMSTDYSAYYSASASATVAASTSSAEALTPRQGSRTSIDGALEYPAPSCPYHAEAEAYIGKLGIGKYRMVDDDRCYCERCYSGPDVLEECPGVVAPRGWVSFALDAPPPIRDDTSGWSSSFYGLASDKVLRRALRNGHLLAPSEALLDGSLMHDDGSESASGLWPEDTSDTAIRLRAFYRIHAPENEEKAAMLAERFADSPTKLNKELRKRHHGADLSDPLFLHECRGRARDAFWTSPTIKYAGLKHYARPEVYGPGTCGDFVGKPAMAACMALQVQQRPGSFSAGPETLGFRRLAKQGFPGWDTHTKREWPHVDPDKVEWTSSEWTPKDARPTALLVRVYPTGSDVEDPEGEHYRSPLDTEHRPLLAQWNNFMSTHHNTSKAPFKPDKSTKRCEGCSRSFGRTMDAREGPQYRRRHHCRACGGENHPSIPPPPPPSSARTLLSMRCSLCCLSTLRYCSAVMCCVVTTNGGALHL